jgi:hypothetical protein
MTDTSKTNKVATAFRHLDPRKGLADGIAPSFPSIRYKGKFWNLMYGGTAYPFKRDDDGTPLSYIDGVIVGVNPHVSRSYFGGVWSEESASPPICYAVDGEVPDPGVPDRQSPSCGICPRNEWFTKADGGRAKECQEHKRMSLLLMPAMTKKMLGAPLMEPVHLKIPPGSFRSLKRYSDALQNENTPYAAVVTRVSFTPNKQFEMAFELVQYLSNKEAEVVLPLMDNLQTRTILGLVPDVRAAIAPPPVRQPKVDTGLLEAFGEPDNDAKGNGQPAPSRARGRPRVVPQTLENEPQQARPATKAVPVQDQLESDTFEESDADLDETVHKLMGDKMNKMLK